MTRLVARTPAKVNLTLEVVGEMPDGYHEVSTLMQAVDLEDELVFDFNPGDKIDISLRLAESCRQEDFPLDETNLIARAVAEFVACLPAIDGLRASVVVDKRIPIGAGLAGGSSDAAATLLALNYYFGHPFGAEDLLALGARLGADVPFLMDGGTSVGRGRGDELTALAPEGDLFFLLAKPRGLSVSTKQVYDAYDLLEPAQRSETWSPPDLVGAVKALTSGNLELASSCFGNDLEPVVFQVNPQLSWLKQRLLSLGCWCCHLTGSGPTLFAVVPDRSAISSLRQRFLSAEQGGTAAGAGCGDVPGRAAPAVDFWEAKGVSHGARLIGDAQI